MVPSGPGCELVWGEAAEARMRPPGIVVDPPFLDDPAGCRQAAEQVHVEALVAEAAVQAFDEAVLHRLARGDVVPLDSMVFLPLQDRMRGQLGSVVADNHERPSTKGDECIELSRDALA